MDTAASVATNIFGYNMRSELVDATMGANEFGYVYDQIGNRKHSSENAENMTYIANALNQYSSISNGTFITRMVQKLIHEKNAAGIDGNGGSV